MFEKASRMKLRFMSDRGQLNVEDLWDLSLTKLNGLAKHLNKAIKEMEEEDFLQEAKASDAVTKLKFDIVLHTLNTKKAERDALKDKQAKKVEKEKLLALLQKKEDAEEELMTKEEILKKIDKLG